MQAAAADKDVWDKEEAARKKEEMEVKEKRREMSRRNILTIEKPWLYLDWRGDWRG